MCSRNNKTEKNRPLLVVITGDSGSGKSYYSKLIRDNFISKSEDFTYINADDFLISRADRDPMKSDFYQEGEFIGKSKWEVLENMFRLEEFARVIADLKQGKSTSYRPYERSTGTVSDMEVTIKPKDIIIFDSSMLLSLMNFVIMVDVNMETIIKLKIRRDSDIRTPKQVEAMHRKVQGYYWKRMKPKNPNIIINNNDFDNPKIQVN